MKPLRLNALVTATLLLSAGTAIAQECQPSKWGADDEIGAANYVTPERVLAALELVKKGETHPLGIVIDPNMPAFPPRKMMLQVVQPNQQYGRSAEQDFGWPIVYNDDVAALWWGMGPQLDGLGHLGEDGMFYNCNEGADFAALTGLTKLGIHAIPPMVGRGVLIDMAALRGRGAGGRPGLRIGGHQGGRGGPGRRDPRGRRRVVPHRVDRCQTGGGARGLGRY